MSGRPGHNSQEGYPSSSPSSLDAHQNDPFSPPQRRYYDNDSEDYGRRDTYASDNSNTGFYDQNGAYDPYRAFTTFSRFPTKLTLSLGKKPHKTPTPMAMLTAHATPLLRSRWAFLGWAIQNHRHQLS